MFLLNPLFNGLQIGPFQTSQSEKYKVKVKLRLNLHGIVSVESASVSIRNMVVIDIVGYMYEEPLPFCNLHSITATVSVD